MCCFVPDCHGLPGLSSPEKRAWVRVDCTVTYKRRVTPEMCISLTAGTVLPLRTRKVECAREPLRSENQFWKDDSRMFVAKLLGQPSK